METEMELLSRIRAQSETDSKQYQEKIKRFTEAGAVAIEAILMAAAGGNTTCQEALVKIYKIYPEIYAPKPPAKKDPPEEEIVDWEAIRTKHSEKP